MRIGASRVSLALDQPAVYRPDPVSGHLEICCLEGEACPARVRVSLYVQDPALGLEVGQPVNETMVLQPGERRTLPFRLRTEMLGTTSSPWRTSVVAVVTIGMETGQVSVAVELRPQRCFVEIAEALAKVADLRLQPWGGVPDGVVAHLLPEADGGGAFSAIRLEMYRAGQHVYGALVVYPKGRTLGERLRSATRLNGQRFDLRLRPDRPEELREVFESVLRPFLDPMRDLPLPARAPGVDGASLPRPAAGPHVED